MVRLELPEIETLRRDLEREAVGKKIKSAEALVLKSLPHHKTRKSFEEPVTGAKVTGVERLGLDLLVRLDNDHIMVIRLGANGRIVRAVPKDPRTDDVAVVLNIDKVGEIRIIDVDGSSSVAVVAADDFDQLATSPNGLGLDLHAKPVSWVEFGRLVLSKRMPLRLLLTDETVFVGIGEIYANEILFDAGLRHDRMAGDLSTQEIRRLYRSFVGILHDAIKHGGTSLQDRPFADLSGKAGEYRDHLAVYGRAGQLSPRSRVPIQKTSFKHQVVFYCNTQV